MEMPWPKRAERLFLDGMLDLPPEEMDRLRSEVRFSQDEDARLRREMLNAKRQVTKSPNSCCPNGTLTHLTVPSAQSSLCIFPHKTQSPCSASSVSL